MSARRVVESDICIVGSGITAAMVAAKLAERTEASIVVVEAGDDAVPLRERARHRQRFLDYGENPWPGDHVDGLEAADIQSRSMQVGGQAMHWGGVTPRFSPEDFRVRSQYGIGADWPIDYDTLEPFYVEAERRLGVAGEAGPEALDPRSAPYPMPALPLSYNLDRLRAWGERGGTPFWSQPSAKNSVEYDGRAQCCRSDTCSPVCPVGAKYSPDFTWNALRGADRVRLIPRTVVRRLVHVPGGDRIDHALALDRDRPEQPVEFRARTFVVAGGYTWSPHLLLLSGSSRFPEGLGNRNGLVGRYVAGHRAVSAQVRLPFRLYPGMNVQHSLVTKRFMRPGPLDRYVRHDLRIWESAAGSGPRLRDDAGGLLLGDALLADWRARTDRGAARLRAYYDVLPGRDSVIELDASRRSPWGDPLPRITLRDDPASAALRGHTEERIGEVFRELVRAGGGEILSTSPSGFQDHPCGGLRMGADPATGVCDAWGRTFDHDNLFIVGAPTCVTASCCNGTLTFVAVALRQAEEIAAGF